MASENVIDTTPSAEATQLDLVRDLASAIAYLADELDEHFAYEFDGWRGNPADVRSRHIEVQQERIRDGLLRMGWMADLISERLNGDPCRGDAEEWLMHPRYRGAKAKLNISSTTESTNG